MISINDQSTSLEKYPRNFFFGVFTAIHMFRDGPRYLILSISCYDSCISNVYLQYSNQPHKSQRLAHSPLTAIWSVASMDRSWGRKGASTTTLQEMSHRSWFLRQLQQLFIKICSTVAWCQWMPAQAPWCYLFLPSKWIFLPSLILYALFDHEDERICKKSFTILHH